MLIFNILDLFHNFLAQRYNKHFVQTNFRIFICRIIRLYFTEIILTKFANKAGIMYLCRQ